MTIGLVDPKTKFNILVKRKTSIEKELSALSDGPKGTLNFTLHKLNKERSRIKQDLALVSFRYTPDTIA